MIPNFNKDTIDTIAKRAAYKCSNPDCRVNTIGPNSNPTKSTKIGEAAHIYGAREGSKRFNSEMQDTVRAEITNAIWLCRNCHKLIDTDEIKYSANILFRWREIHEEFVASTLGTKTDQIIFDEKVSILVDFENYPPIVKRIVIDRPFGWEWRLTAELLRHLNDPLFRKLKDLKEGLYLKDPIKIESENIFPWVQDRIKELQRIVTPAEELLARLSKSWGEPGEPGDIKEIHHITKLIKDYLEYVISFEEKIYFVIVPDEYQKLVSLFKDLLGSQIEKLSSIPDYLDEIVLLAKKIEDEDGEDQEIKKTIKFDIPEAWLNDFNYELKRLNL